MRQFHPLIVERLDKETRDSMRIALQVPEDLRDEYSFVAGQHLPVRAESDGKSLRRTYSICSAPGHWPLEIGVRIQPGGAFGEYAAKRLTVGDTLDAMPPFGQFHVDLDEAGQKDYVVFAAGSGITPILSMTRAILDGEPGSRVALFYGNRKQSTTMFIDDLYALKNLYPTRLQLNFVFSQEDQEFPIAAGRLDEVKVRELLEHCCAGLSPVEAYVCGPDTMIDTVTKALGELGIDNVHAERFGVPRGKARKIVPGKGTEDHAEVTVIMDGHKKSFDMPRSGTNIVDAAAEHGIDLPYSCKGGVCATCRTHVREGDVEMGTNYGLEPWEVEAGFILACQSCPTTDNITLDYDKT